MIGKPIPQQLTSLHQREEDLREKAMALIAGDDRLILHLIATERAMDMVDALRQCPCVDQDFKAVALLGIRVFNAFGAATKLVLSGYSQHAAMVLRDILETVFLMDLFQDRSLIAIWRNASKKVRKDRFSPFAVRKALDERDGFVLMKRAEIYALFSELAGHPTMTSFAMLSPKGMDAQIGPFIDPGTLEAVISEMGKLAVQVGGTADKFIPHVWIARQPTQVAFNKVRKAWFYRFYGPAFRAAMQPALKAAAKDDSPNLKRQT